MIQPKESFAQNENLSTNEKKVNFPENLYLKEKITESGMSVTYLARKIGISRVLLSKTIHGKHKGIYIVPALLKIITPETSK
jgi:hypothetical protein